MPILEGVVRHIDAYVLGKSFLRSPKPNGEKSRSTKEEAIVDVDKSDRPGLAVDHARSGENEGGKKKKKVDRSYNKLSHPR